MNLGIALLIVLVILAIAYVGVELLGLTAVFAIALPYIAFAVFVIGFIYRIVNWSKSPVPFRIPTTCGQQKIIGFYQTK